MSYSKSKLYYALDTDNNGWDISSFPLDNPRLVTTYTNFSDSWINLTAFYVSSADVIYLALQGGWHGGVYKVEDGGINKISSLFPGIVSLQQDNNGKLVALGSSGNYYIYDNNKGEFINLARNLDDGTLEDGITLSDGGVNIIKTNKSGTSYRYCLPPKKYEFDCSKIIANFTIPMMRNLISTKHGIFLTGDLKSKDASIYEYNDNSLSIYKRFSGEYITSLAYGGGFLWVSVINTY